MRCSECTGDFTRVVEPKELVVCDYCNADFYIPIKKEESK